LLPGPDKHRISRDLPAYEIPTGDAAVRVLARKHCKRAEWLVTAWAADGEAREVEVSFPDLGKLNLRSSPEGEVYRISLNKGVSSIKKVDL
jgi:hypothetical protein